MSGVQVEIPADVETVDGLTNIEMSVTVTDVSETGFGDDLIDVGTVCVSLIPVNDGPEVIVPDGVDGNGDCVNVAVEGGESVQPLDGVAISDVDSDNLQEAVITYDVPLPDGVVVKLNVGAQAALESNNLTIVYTANGVTISGEAPISVYEEVLAGLTYTNPDDNEEPRQPLEIALTLAVTDVSETGFGDDLTDQGETCLVIDPVNDGPEVDLPGGDDENGNCVNVAVEGGESVQPLDGITISDVDSDNLQEAVITYDKPLPSGVVVQLSSQTQSLLSNNGLTITYSANGVTISGEASIDVYESILAGLTYLNPTDNEEPGQPLEIVLTLQVTDVSETGKEDHLTDQAETCVVIDPVNDAPVFVSTDPQPEDPSDQSKPCVHIAVEGGDPTYPFEDYTITDVDSDRDQALVFTFETLDGLDIVFSQAAQDAIDLYGLQVIRNGNTIEILGNAPISAYNAVLQGFGVVNVDDAADNAGTRNIAITVSILDISETGKGDHLRDYIRGCITIVNEDEEETLANRHITVEDEWLLKHYVADIEAIDSHVHIHHLVNGHVRQLEAQTGDIEDLHITNFAQPVTELAARFNPNVSSDLLDLLESTKDARQAEMINNELRHQNTYGTALAS